jgi:hypothetical protein
MPLNLLIRRIHLYVGLLISPSVLFFALTGAVQLFGLHEAHEGYRPAPVVERLGELHKNQRFSLKERRPDVPALHVAMPGGVPAAEEADPPTPLREILLKWTFLAVASGLILSTGLGLWIALTSPRTTTVHWILLAFGALLPLGILVV